MSDKLLSSQIEIFPISMDLDIEKVKETGKKSKAVITALGLGVSSLAGATILDDSADTNDMPENIDQKQDAPQKISSQIDENRNKLDTLSASSQDSETDYTKYGC